MKDGIKLEKDMSDAEATENGLTSFLNKTGVAATDLRPAGIARIGEERVDVVTNGDMIPEGTDICVVEIEANRVVVEKAKLGKGKE